MKRIEVDFSFPRSGLIGWFNAEMVFELHLFFITVAIWK